MSWYVMVKSGSQRGLVAGPFETKGEADEMVPLAQRAAANVDGTSHFYEWGVAEVFSNRPGRLNGKLGLTQGEVRA